MKYFVIPEGKDGCSFPTTPEPMELPEVAAHIARYLETLEINSKQMGRPASFSNANREHIPLSELAFTLVPAEPDQAADALEEMEGWEQ